MFRLFTNHSNSPIKVEQNHFPDGTLHLDLPFYGVTKILWNYENDSELFTLICLKKHFDQFCDGIELHMPYIPHARMDRVKDTNDVFTLKYFCEVINSLNFESVTVFDAHSNVSLALLDRVKEVSIEKCLFDTLTNIVVDVAGDIGHFTRERVYENLIIFFPDEGAMKRYSESTNLPYTFGVKKRDWKTGKIEGLQVMNGEVVKGKNILIIDDICSRGGTFLYSAKALKELGAENVYLYVSHAENTMVEGEMYNTPDLVKKIYTTDTIFNIELDTRHKVKIVPSSAPKLPRV